MNNETYELFIIRSKTCVYKKEAQYSFHCRLSNPHDVLFVIHTSTFAHISQSTGYVNETKCRAELLFILQELIGLWKSGCGIPDKSGVHSKLLYFERIMNSI